MTDSSTREVAERIVGQVAVGCWQFQSPGWLTEMIDEALRNERERCAKIADAKAEDHTKQAKEYVGYKQMRWAEDNYNAAAVCRDVAAAIRSDVQEEGNKENGE